METPGTGTFEFPGESAFAPRYYGEEKSLPPGPASVLYKTAAPTPDAGDGLDPILAVTYATAPAGPAWIAFGSTTDHNPVFALPYRATVPSSGALVLRFAFSQAYDLSDVLALARTAERVVRQAGAVPGTTPSPVAGRARVVVVGRATARGNTVRVRVACSGLRGPTCGVTARLTARLAGRAGRGAVRRLVVATTSRRRASGHRGTLRLLLDRRGRAERHRHPYRRLTVRLAVVQSSPGPRRTIATRRVAFAPAARQNAAKRRPRRG